MTSMPSMRATREVENAGAGAAERAERRARRAEVLMVAAVWLMMWKDLCREEQIRLYNLEGVSDEI